MLVILTKPQQATQERHESRVYIIFLLGVGDRTESLLNADGKREGDGAELDGSGVGQGWR
jgi:hypothetical protein